MTTTLGRTRTPCQTGIIRDRHGAPAICAVAIVALRLCARQVEELFDLGNQFFPQARHRAVERTFVGSLGHIVVGPQGQRLQRHRGAALGERAEHDDAQMGIFAPNAPQRFEAIHLRHLDVQREHVGIQLRNPLQGDRAVRRAPTTSSGGILLEGVRDQAPDDHRVVHHQHANSLSRLE